MFNGYSGYNCISLGVNIHERSANTGTLSQPAVVHVDGCGWKHVDQFCNTILLAAMATWKALEFHCIVRRRMHRLRAGSKWGRNLWLEERRHMLTLYPGDVVVLWALKHGYDFFPGDSCTIGGMSLIIPFCVWFQRFPLFFLFPREGC